MGYDRFQCLSGIVEFPPIDCGGKGRVGGVVRRIRHCALKVDEGEGRNGEEGTKE